MDDVFHYNSGSLLQALNPDQTLVNLSDEEWVGTSPTTSRRSSRPTTACTARPWGTSFAGAVMYNKAVYEQLGLEVPTTWDEFIANSEKIKAEGGGVAPILQSYGDTWTSQLFVLGDFANVYGAGPRLGREVHGERQGQVRRRARVRRLRAHGAEVFEKGLLNEDFASMTNAQAMDALATGAGAQYPMLIGDDRDHAAEQPRQGGRHRRLRPARSGCRRHGDHDLAAERDLHPQDHRGRQARRGQEVRGVRELGRGLRGAERDRLAPPGRT